MEPTGGYNGAANGPAETGGGMAKGCMRSALYGGGKPAPFWCFAITYGAALLNIRGRRKNDYVSGHEALFGVVPFSDHLRIWASKIYVLIQRRSRRCNDRVSKALPGTFMGCALFCLRQYYGLPQVSVFTCLFLCCETMFFTSDISAPMQKTVFQVTGLMRSLRASDRSSDRFCFYLPLAIVT